MGKVEARAGCHGRGRRNNSDWQISFQYGGSEESSLSRDVNNALNEGKLACQHRSCTVNDIFIA